jgi:tRNA (guanine26-N2/guanine27-N2)-dimethyltransferase
VVFIGSSIRALRNGGLLAATATDMAPLCGIYPRVALRKYGGFSLRTEYCHEIAIRLLAGSIVMSAAKHDIGFQLLFAYCANHYVRIHCKLQHSAKMANDSVRNIGYIIHCFNCLNRKTLKLSATPSSIHLKCDECGHNMHIAGPLWLGAISDGSFCKMMLRELITLNSKSKKELSKKISLIMEESDAPITYYRADKIADKLGVRIPSMKNIVEMLKEQGAKTTLTHHNGMGFRSNASIRVIKQVFLN